MHHNSTPQSPGSSNASHLNCPQLALVLDLDHTLLEAHTHDTIEGMREAHRAHRCVACVAIRTHKNRRACVARVSRRAAARQGARPVMMC